MDFVPAGRGELIYLGKSVFATDRRTLEFANTSISDRDANHDVVASAQLRDAATILPYERGYEPAVS